MTLEEAAKMAFGCCIDMSKSLTHQYFWLTVRFLENDSNSINPQRPDPRDILKIVEEKVERMIANHPTLVK